MLQVARLAPKQLGESRDLVAGFFRSSLNPDGGFRNRTGESDLYYTVFGLEGLIALQEPVPTDRVTPYLRRFDRVTTYDVALRNRRLAFHIGDGPPKVTRSIAEAMD